MKRLVRAMVARRRNPYRDLEASLGYRFRRRDLLEAALIHPSFRFETDGVGRDNQRLEFLGDAVLGLVTAAYFFDKFSDEDEGGLTTFRSRVTSGKALVERAQAVDLGAYLRVGKGEERSGGRHRHSNLADGIEAVIGAAFVDGGLEAARRIFNKLFLPGMENLSADIWAGNPKGRLQAYCQNQWKIGPRYRLVGSEGPAHAAVFNIEVVLEDGTVGVGRGRNKREAETEAALDALRRLRV